MNMPQQALRVEQRLDAARAIGVHASANSGSSAETIALEADASSTSGTAYAIKVVNGYCYLNLPTSAGPTGTLYSNLGVVTVA